MSGIAERRAERARLKKKRKSWWAGEPPKTNVQLGRLINTPTPCSCWMCGNPRRRLGERTIGEQRWFQEIEDEQE